MFVPFCFTLSPDGDYRYLWVFYHYLMLAKKNGWPMVSREMYFEDPEAFVGIDTSVDVRIALAFEYDTPTKEDIDSVQKFAIPENLIQELTTIHGSQSDAFVHLLKERDEIFETCLRELFIDIQTKNPTERIEAVVTLLSYPSLLHVAKEFGFPIIHNEWGPLRMPAYRNTAYLDFSGLFDKAECEERYNAFMAELQCSSVPLFTRKEILSIFLRPDRKEAINYFNNEPTYEIGLATGHAVEYIFLPNTMNGNLELILQAKRNYELEEILLRTHPGDPSCAAYRLKNNDRSDTSMNFIMQSRRVATVFSNVAFEAMLWGKTAYTTGKCAYTFKAKHNLSDKEESVVEIEFINFVAFAYLVPYELTVDEEYLRWRLTMPSEIEIYRRHLDYYFADLGIDKSLLELPEDERVYRFLEAQGFDATGNILTERSANDDLIFALNRLADTISGLKPCENAMGIYRQIQNHMYWVPRQQRQILEQAQGLKWYEEFAQQQQQYIEELQSHIHAVENSRLWKIISKLRYPFKPTHTPALQWQDESHKDDAYSGGK